MTKFLRIAIVILGLCNPVFAERSAGFLGLEAGYRVMGIPIISNTQGIGALEVDANGGGAAFGFVGGYKQFANPYFGLRYYANVNVIIAGFKPKIKRDTAGTGLYNGMFIRDATIINYALNIDMLVNFITRESRWNRVADFGAFVGLGFGGNSWFSKSFDEMKDWANNIYQKPLPIQRNFFDLSLNVGLRTNIAYNHGLELALRMPMLKNTFVKNQDKINIYAKAPNYNITLRYTYSFDFPKTKRVSKTQRVIKKREKPTINQNDIVSQGEFDALNLGKVSAIYVNDSLQLDFPTLAEWKQSVDSKPFALFFFTTTCGVCKEQIPILQEIVDESTKIYGVLGNAPSVDLAQKYAESSAITLPIFYESKAKRFFTQIIGGAEGVPVVVTFDKDGRVKGRFMGLTPKDVLKNALQNK